MSTKLWCGIAAMAAITWGATDARAAGISVTNYDARIVFNVVAERGAGQSVRVTLDAEKTPHPLDGPRPQFIVDGDGGYVEADFGGSAADNFATIDSFAGFTYGDYYGEHTISDGATAPDVLLAVSLEIESTDVQVNDYLWYGTAPTEWLGNDPDHVSNGDLFISKDGEEQAEFAFTVDVGYEADVLFSGDFYGMDAAIFGGAHAGTYLDGIGQMFTFGAGTYVIRYGDYVDGPGRFHLEGENLTTTEEAYWAQVVGLRSTTGVPEPTSVALVALGGAALVVKGRRARG